MSSKKEIRESVSARRNAMTEKEVFLESHTVIENFLASEQYKSARSVLFYCSVRGEVYTHGAISAALSAGKIVFLPKSNIKSKSLELYKINSMSDLVKGAYGVMEPIPDKSREIQVFEIDLVIVPGVAFDKEGNRIGLGLGYYDRLLPGIANTGKICTLAYSFQIAHQVPHDAHDVPVDYIFHEDKVIDCRKFRTQKHKAGKNKNPGKQ